MICYGGKIYTTEENVTLQTVDCALGQKKSGDPGGAISKMPEASHL